jgi:outer membrane murein-binding lipoprotein Lpp
MWKVMKKLLTAIASSTVEIGRKIGDLGANQARGFEATTASLNELAAQMRELNARQQTSYAEVSALRADVHALRGFKTNSVRATGAQIIPFAPNHDLDRRKFAVAPVNRNHNNNGIEADSYNI